MAYLPTNIVARRGYSGMGSWTDIWDTVKSGVKGGIDFYGQTQQQAGAAAATAAQNAALTQVLANQQHPPSPLGISTTTLAIVGVAGLGLFLALRK